MSDAKKITDEELKNVSGGGSGAIPEKGITFSTYSTVDSGRYYSRAMDLSDVVYVYQSWLGQEYTREQFTVDKATGRWSSKSISSYGNGVGTDFKNNYPYKLNVTP